MPSFRRRIVGVVMDVGCKVPVGVLVALVMSIPAYAQDAMPGPLRLTCLETANNCFGRSSFSGDQAPRPSTGSRTAADRDAGRFHLLLGAFLTAAGADVGVSVYQVQRGTAREVGFGAWWQDSPVAFTATKGAMAALFAYQLQRLHRERPKTAIVLGIVGTAVEAALAARGARMGPQAP